MEKRKKKIHAVGLLSMEVSWVAAVSHMVARETLEKREKQHQVPRKASLVSSKHQRREGGKR